MSVDMEYCDSMGERLCERERERDDMTKRYLWV